MIATVIDRAGDQLGDFLPRILGALAVPLRAFGGLVAAIAAALAGAVRGGQGPGRP